MNENFDPNNSGNVFRMPQEKDDRPLWPALTSFILSIANVLMCCCCIYMTVPVSMVLGTVSLAKKWRGKGFAISGIIISAVTVVTMVGTNIIFGEEIDDMSKIVAEPDKYIAMYEETGEVPEEFMKYTDEKYDSYWKNLGFEDFEDFYGRYVISYLARFYSGSFGSVYQSSGSSSREDSGGYSGLPDHYGEEPVNI